MQGGLAVLGMTLRALGVGAADGFAQWGDPKAYPILTKYIEDQMGNDQSRLEACFALSWVATDEQMKDVVKKVHEWNKPDPKSAFITKCYLETLIHRPVPAATAGLIDLLKPDVDMEVRHQAARAIGFGGLTSVVRPDLEKLLGDTNTRADAALALLIGGSPEDAAQALASVRGRARRGDGGAQGRSTTDLRLLERPQLRGRRRRALDRERARRAVT